MYGALEHSALPFDLLLDELAIPRFSAYPPVFQILMDYKLVTTEQSDMNCVGCNMSEPKSLPSSAPFDIVLEIVEDRESAVVSAYL